MMNNENITEKGIENLCKTKLTKNTSLTLLNLQQEGQNKKSMLKKLLECTNIKKIIL